MKTMMNNGFKKSSIIMLMRAADNSNWLSYTAGVWNLLQYERGTFLILVIKTNNMYYFSNLFWYRTLHILDRFSIHHQESSTVYTATGICYRSYADCLLARSGS